MIGDETDYTYTNICGYIYYLLIKSGGVVADETVESVVDGDAGELLGADIGGAEEGELALVEVRVRQEHEIRDGEAQCGVSEELEPLIRRRISVGRVSESLLQEPSVFEFVFEKLLHRSDGVGHVRDVVVIASVDGVGVGYDFVTRWLGHGLNRGVSRERM